MTKRLGTAALRHANIESFKTRLVHIRREIKYVVIQVIENILEDSVKAKVGADGAITDDIHSLTLGCKPVSSQH